MNIQTVMTADASGEALVSFAKATADRLVKQQLKKTQVRNVFSEVRKIEADWQTDHMRGLRRLNMLKPKLQYQTVRMSELEHLADVLTKAIDLVNKGETDAARTERFQRFLDLFEAILAYHRAAVGR